jgi:methionine synthase II (cobalamin-independent)
MYCCASLIRCLINSLSSSAGVLEVIKPTPALEDKELIKQRIKEAQQYISLDQICLSPQCGFASTEEGKS